MKLLDPKSAAKQKQDFDEANTAARNLLNQETAQLAALRERVDRDKKKINDDFEKFYAEHFIRVGELQKEIGEIKKSREHELKPVAFLLEEAQGQKLIMDRDERNLERRMKEQVSLGNEVSLKHFVLESKLKDLAKDEYESDQYRKKIENDFKDLKLHEVAFANERAAWNTTYHDERNKLQIERFETEKLEVGLAEREQLLADGWVEFKKKQIHLESQQQTLRSAFEEAKKRNLL